MAYNKKLRGKYFSIVYYYDDFKNRQQCYVPLKTNLKSEAEKRKNEVEKFEALIQKQGSYKEPEFIEFSWMSGGGRTKVRPLTFDQAYDDYIAVKRLRGLRPKTFDIIDVAINSFRNFHNAYKKPIGFITDSHINEWIKYSIAHHSATTTNIYLTKLKTFFNFCYKKKYMPTQLDIEKVSEDGKKPMYLSETKLGKLFSSDMVDEHFRKAFLFYAMTGCRLQEPFEGEISGNWLILSAEKTKTSEQREIELNKTTYQILIEMKERYNNLLGSSGNGFWSKSHKGIIDSYFKAFKKVAISEGFGEYKFHNLRDTYAVRRWIETGDIHLVSKEIGHKNVMVTQKYANFNLKLLSKDFQSLAPIINSRLNKDLTNNSLIELCSTALRLN